MADVAVGAAPEAEYGAAGRMKIVMIVPGVTVLMVADVSEAVRVVVIVPGVAVFVVADIPGRIAILPPVPEWGAVPQA